MRWPRAIAGGRASRPAAKEAPDRIRLTVEAEYRKALRRSQARWTSAACSTTPSCSIGSRPSATRPLARTSRETLCEARAADARPVAWTPALEVRFWSAYRKLNSVISPITADTITGRSAPGSPRPGIMGWSEPRQPHRHRRPRGGTGSWGVLALAYVLYLQIYLALGGSVLADVVRLCPSSGRDEGVLIAACYPTGRDGDERRGRSPDCGKGANARCCSRPGAQDASQAPAADALLFSSSMDVVHRMNKMNLFWFFHWYFQDDEFSPCWTTAGRLDLLSWPCSGHHLQIPAAAALRPGGTCAYIIRTVSVEIQNVLYSQETHSRYQLRLFLGALAGLSAAWFVTLEGRG